MFFAPSSLSENSLTPLYASLMPLGAPARRAHRAGPVGFNLGCCRSAAGLPASWGMPFLAISPHFGLFLCIYQDKKPFKVECAANEEPFAINSNLAPKRKPAEAHNFLDNPEYGLYCHFPQPVNGAPYFCFELMAHLH